MQNYEVTAVEKSDFQDNYGNSWLTIVVAGLNEPVKLVVKDPNSVNIGDTLYGEIVEAESKKGNKYLRFKKGQKESGGGGYQESPERQEAITKSVSLNNAVLYWQGIIVKDPVDVLGVADVFYAWLKGESIVPEEKPVKQAEDESEPQSEPKKSPRDWGAVGKGRAVTANDDYDQEMFPSEYTGESEA